MHKQSGAYGSSGLGGTENEDKYVQFDVVGCEWEGELMTYKRTRGYRNWLNRSCWIPIISDDIAYFKSGRCYEVRRDGWRRIGIIPPARVESK